MTLEQFGNVFASNVIQLLNIRNMTQRQFADILGVTEQAVSDRLAVRHPPSARVIVAYANALGVEPWKLLKPKRKK